MHKSEVSLKQAVEQQLDLILRMQEDRKVLKKENKILNEKYQHVLTIMKKYSVEKQERATMTEIRQNAMSNEKSKGKQVKKAQVNQYCQTDLETYVNSCKLSEAQLLLKTLDTTEQRNVSTVKQQVNSFSKQPKKMKSTAALESTSKQEQQISNQILKMAKQISGLKRQLKEEQSKHKAKDKQIKQLKQCIEVKNQALQKSRKQFNELSNVFNSDRYKSVRKMDNDLIECKARLFKAEQQAKLVPQLKDMLAQLTKQYELYKLDMTSKTQRLMAQLKNKVK